jgi:hypothetical protein
VRPSGLTRAPLKVAVSSQLLRGRISEADWLSRSRVQAAQVTNEAIKAKLRYTGNKWVLRRPCVVSCCADCVRRRFQRLLLERHAATRFTIECEWPAAHAVGCAGSARSATCADLPPAS